MIPASSQASLHMEVRRIRVIERDVVMEGKGRDREKGEERKERRERDSRLLALKMEKEATSQGIQGPLEAGGHKERDSPQSRSEPASRHLDVSETCVGLRILGTGK